MNKITIKKPHPKLFPYDIKPGNLFYGEDNENNTIWYRTTEGALCLRNHKHFPIGQLNWPAVDLGPYTLEVL